MDMVFGFAVAMILFAILLTGMLFTIRSDDRAEPTD
jgi:hypothetical protein